jgi:hypothetical protein
MGTTIHRQGHRRDKRGLADKSDDKEAIHEQNLMNLGRAIKKAHRISGRTFVVIPDAIVFRLGINEDTWFEEEVIDNGIFLRKYAI